MARYSLQFKRSVAKDLRNAPKKHVQWILQRIEHVADDSRPDGCEKLSSREVYRVRQGRARILYEIADKELSVFVIKVGPRDTPHADSGTGRGDGRQATS